MTKEDKQLRAQAEKIGNNLVRLRKKMGYDTIVSFSRAHDLPEIQYFRVEHGRANVTLRTLIRLANIHGVDIKKILS